ncbi:MAG: hypothetical protein RIR52_2700 [Acidobacteriota bacterium]
MWGIGRLFRVPARKAVTSSGDLGRQGEEIARRYLTRQGYRVVVAGFTTPIGRSRGGRQVRAEIDLIAWDESQSPSTLAFIEVKTRSRGDLIRPEAAVDRRKQRHLIRAARVFRRMVRVENEAFRYDVVSIVIREQGAVPEIALLRNYFHE